MNILRDARRSTEAVPVRVTTVSTHASSLESTAGKAAAEHVETIVVGGGHAGLSVSWHLKEVGREHLIFDRGKIADTWRRRWDSFCLVTPNWLCQLPGFPYDGNQPAGFMLREEIVDYIERYAKSFDPPYRGEVEVRQIRASSGRGRFEVETSEGSYRADNVIVATGPQQNPSIPAWASRLPGDIVQLHTQDYRNPNQLPDGAILIVGGGQSGCQIAEDLLAAGREVHLSIGRASRVPRRYRGRDIHDWFAEMGSFDLPIDKHPLGHKARFIPQPQLSGRDGGKSIDLRQLALDGVNLHGRALDADGATVRLAGDVADTLDAIDETCRQRLSEVDDYIWAHGIDAPVDDIVAVDWRPSGQQEFIDLGQAKIRTLIYGTGYHLDFRYIDLPVFNEDGYPRQRQGVTEVPGLYFIGLRYLHTQGSGIFYGVGRDAAHIVDHLEQLSRPKRKGERRRGLQSHRRCR